MRLELSTPEIGASKYSPEVGTPVSGGAETSPFSKFGAEEPTSAVSKLGTESLGVLLVPSAPLAPIELAFGEAQLLSLQEERRGGVSELDIPALEWPARQDVALTSSVRGLLRTLWAIVVSRALQASFPLETTIVCVFEDPTEQERKAVLRLTCNANVAQALAFWDSLETDLQGWLKTLTESDRTTFITRLALRVHWR